MKKGKKIGVVGLLVWALWAGTVSADQEWLNLPDWVLPNDFMNLSPGTSFQEVYKKFGPPQRTLRGAEMCQQPPCEEIYVYGRAGKNWEAQLRFIEGKLSFARIVTIGMDH